MHRLSQFVLISVLVFLTHASKLTYEFGKREVTSDTQGEQATTSDIVTSLNDTKEGQDPQPPIVATPVDIPLDNGSVQIMVPAVAVMENATINTEEKELVETNAALEDNETNASKESEVAQFSEEEASNEVQPSSASVVSDESASPEVLEDGALNESSNVTQEVTDRVLELEPFGSNEVTQQELVNDTLNAVEEVAADLNVMNKTILEVETDVIIATEQVQVALTDEDKLLSNGVSESQITDATLQESSNTTNINEGDNAKVTTANLTAESNPVIVSEVISNVTQQVDKTLSEVTSSIINSTSDTNVTVVVSEIMSNVTENINGAITEYFEQITNMTGENKMSNVVSEILKNINQSVDKAINETVALINEVTSGINDTINISDTVANVTVEINEAISAATTQLNNETKALNVTINLSEVVSTVNQSFDLASKNIISIITELNNGTNTDQLISEIFQNVTQQFESVLKNATMSLENETVEFEVATALTNLRQSIDLIVEEALVSVSVLLPDSNVSSILSQALSDVDGIVIQATSMLTKLPGDSLLNLTKIVQESSTMNEATSLANATDITVNELSDITESTQQNLTGVETNITEESIGTNEALGEIDGGKNQTLSENELLSQTSTIDKVVENATLSSEESVNEKYQTTLEELGTVNETDLSVAGFTTSASIQKEVMSSQTPILDATGEISSELSSKKPGVVSITTLPIFSTTSLTGTDEKDVVSGGKKLKTRRQNGADTDSDSDDEDDDKPSTTQLPSKTTTDADTDTDDD